MRSQLEAAMSAEGLAKLQQVIAQLPEVPQADASPLQQIESSLQQLAELQRYGNQAKAYHTALLSQRDVALRQTAQSIFGAIRERIQRQVEQLAALLRSHVKPQPGLKAIWKRAKEEAPVEGATTADLLPLQHALNALEQAYHAAQLERHSSAFDYLQAVQLYWKQHAALGVLLRDHWLPFVQAVSAVTADPRSRLIALARQIKHSPDLVALTGIDSADGTEGSPTMAYDAQLSGASIALQLLLKSGTYEALAAPPDIRAAIRAAVLQFYVTESPLQGLTVSASAEPSSIASAQRHVQRAYVELKKALHTAQSQQRGWQQGQTLQRDVQHFCALKQAFKGLIDTRNTLLKAVQELNSAGADNIEAKATLLSVQGVLGTGGSTFKEAAVRPVSTAMQSKADTLARQLLAEARFHEQIQMLQQSLLQQPLNLMPLERFLFWCFDTFSIKRTQPELFLVDARAAELALPDLTACLVAWFTYFASRGVNMQTLQGLQDHVTEEHPFVQALKGTARGGIVRTIVPGLFKYMHLVMTQEGCSVQKAADIMLQEKLDVLSQQDAIKVVCNPQRRAAAAI